MPRQNGGLVGRIVGAVSVGFAHFRSPPNIGADDSADDTGSESDPLDVDLSYAEAATTDAAATGASLNLIK